MGAVGGLLGLNGGVSGTGIDGPQKAWISNPTDPNQTTTAYQGVQGGLDAQNALLAALGNQNGIGNQSWAFAQGQGLNNQLAAANGVGNQMAAAQGLQGVANGTGPNPAQTMLNQATGQNVQNQAALMAGQRGAGANVGLLARQAAMQGANTQQQAVGQGATMQANQSLNALNNLGNIGTSQVGQQQAQQNQLAGQANQMATNQAGQTNANSASQQAEQGNLFNMFQNVNSSNVGAQSSVNSANAANSTGIMGNQAAGIGGLAQGAGAYLAGKHAAGGDITAPGPKSKLGQHLLGFTNKAMGGEMSQDYTSGGKVAASSSDQQAVTAPATNSLKNDKIPAILSEHEIVLPRSVTMSANAPQMAAKFVQAVIAKRKAKK